VAEQDAHAEVDLDEVGVTSFPSTTTPGVTNILRPQFVMFL
jgi:hypothetical protein